ncbi:MAG: hypothetical protein IIA51_04010 [Chloroflexi bacterium]|nr:hypothetical protein [Chloroflexota bacterium]MDK1045365.1 hypothetical protein [Anaerolineales bacterium]MCH8338668.1 hypothetical protein [Chloroflexota bacterium]MCH8340704.1 hypothetical protein [Chloroflexota bacterium]MCH8878184.1 hypothetical protein [Chloroflexota bacterium]
MPEALALVILVPSVSLTLVALFVAMRALFPRQIGDVKSTGSTKPGRSFLLGLINVSFLSVIVAALSGGGEFLQLVAILLFAVLVGGLAFGLAGMALLLGERLLPESSEIRQAAWGSAVMIVASLTPFVGWLLLFPYLLFRGLGALILSLFIRPVEPPTT